MSDTILNSGADENSPARQKLGQQLTSIQVMLAVALTIGLVLALNFSSRISLDRDLARIHAEFSREIDALLARQGELIAELDYVKSDAYVEYWARDEGKMTRDGEFLILPQSVGGADLAPSSPRRWVEFQTTPPQPRNWELWWALFFDEAPPGQ
ncbi:MAG: hypothetical protein F4X02_15605 [Chloroflexi bacterium]|nr:hypothetical protein [Chloroflexota bacterium]